MVQLQKYPFLILLLIYLGIQVESDASDHSYSEGDTVPFYANKIAPFHNSRLDTFPKLRWYRGVLPQMALAGILPFSVIYIQLYYIFASVWGHRIYTLYSIVSIVFFLLLIMTALVSVALTYFQLAAEDHQWWWRSFLCGGSTGLYIYVYCIYYYFERSDMNGFMQTSFFFGYMACVCFGIFLILGSVGFNASLLFVRYLYAAIKCD